MKPETLAATLITLNEESNIRQALTSLDWIHEKVLVDSGSTDQTLVLAKSFRGTHVISNSWKGYGQQKNFAHEQCKSDWILNIDADERVTDELRKEIEDFLKNPGDIVACYIPRKTIFLGQWVKHGGWYPNAVARLYRKSKCKWSEPAIHETLEFTGKSKTLLSPLLHYTFENLEDQVKTNIRYAKAGALALKAANKKAVFLKILLKPIGKFIETYFLKRGFLV